MPLPTEVLSTIAEVVKRRPSDDIPALVSEVVETLAGKDPDKVVAWMQSSGGTSEFVRLLVSEIRRLKSVGHGRS